MACKKLRRMGQGECDGLSPPPPPNACSFSYKMTYKVDTRILSLLPLLSVTNFFFLFVFKNLKNFHLKIQRKDNHLWSSDFKLLRGNKSKKKHNNKGHPGSSIHPSTVNRIKAKLPFWGIVKNF